MYVCIKRKVEVGDVCMYVLSGRWRWEIDPCRLHEYYTVECEERHTAMAVDASSLVSTSNLGSTLGGSSVASFMIIHHEHVDSATRHEKGSF